MPAMLSVSGFARGVMSMSRKLLTCGLVFAAGVGLSLPSQSATLFSDNFNADSGSTVLNFDSLFNWTVSEGTVDYIRGGAYGITCLGGVGGCLDMDGSSNNAGRITSKDTFTLLPGVTYWLEAQVSGNQRGGAADSLIFGLLDSADDTALVNVTIASINSGDPFSLLGAGFTTGGSTVEVRFFIEGVGGDNLGAILDNVTFRDSVNVVPLPAALPLFLSGLAGLGFVARRRKQLAT